MNCNTTHYRANSSSVPGDPTNPLFYRNLLIELGVLVPLFASVLLVRSRGLRSGRSALLLGGLALVCLGFMAWAMSLPR